MWLDFAEDQAKRRTQVFLQDWERKLDDLLRLNDREVLPSPGKVSRKDAKDHAKVEYNQSAARRRALLEAEGEHTMDRALENAVAKLPTRKVTPAKRGKSS
jgi:hypothetical protein